MPKLRKKQIEVDAIQWDGTEECFDKLLSWCGLHNNGRSWVSLHPGRDKISIWTPAGLVDVPPGDWIIKVAEGRFYTMPRDLLSVVFEPAEEPAMKTMADVRNAVDRAVRANSEAAGQWTLGQLIDALEKRGPGTPVFFDFADFAPRIGVNSYRGHYDQLAMAYGSVAGKGPVVAEVLEWLRAAVGETYEGYKGGRYTMSRDTMLWVANPGEAGGTAVVGLYENITWCAMIRTAYVD